MSQIDIVKETIAYLKFWLGVMVVSDITFSRLATLKCR